MKCWYCDKEVGWESDAELEKHCVNCGVLNDRNPYPPVTEKKEAEVAINYGDEKYQGKFIYMPKIGEEITIEIKELREVKSDNPKFNFSESVPVMIGGEPAIDDEGEVITKKKDLGYHVEAELTNGKILSVTSIAAFIQVFKKNELNDGDKVRIKHVEKGIWEVEKL